MFVDFLEKSVVEDALARIGKSLGFVLKHGTLDADKECHSFGSPIWWRWYEYEQRGGEDSENAADKVYLFHFGTCQIDYGLRSHYTESASMLEDVLTTKEFIVCSRLSSRYTLPTRISNPFVGTRSLEELQMKLDLLGGEKA